ncbi:hypothetical protein [Rhizobium sp. C4]|uniref:hypothetical protein n=1 Tax=Rhizobium sp. C4 TaxID=1349800 RepID=UPI001E408BF1|nr:hypothetical protein [Rhizobium sp. C4]MCD2175364.1 hypothetical protein [Rhizobium sp. C4]
MSARLAYQPANPEVSLDPSRQQFWIAAPSEHEGFGPRQHVANLHPTNSGGGLRKGVVSFAQRVFDGKKHWREWTVPAADAILRAEEALQYKCGEDVYVSQQTFNRWRNVADLSALGACYVDLDYHTRARWQYRDPEAVAAAVIDTLENGGERPLPLPSYILATGRGLVCVWLTELLPFRVLPRWSAVQRHLAEALKGFGADKRALDAARVFRLVGSTNSRAEWHSRTVRLVWWKGSPVAPDRHEFGNLADDVLPFTQAELRSLQAARATRDAADNGTRRRTSQQLSGATYWSTVFQDLQRLRHHRDPERGALPAGQRDAWLFVAANALAWTDCVAVTEAEIRTLAAQAAGWSDPETKARMSAVLKRASMAVEGKTIEFRGREVDPRYRMKAQTIVEWLQIEPDEMRGAGLRVLIDEDRRRERGAERQADRRRSQGAKDRDELKATRLELGQKCLYLSAKDGMTRADLAHHFGVSTGQISKAMREARASSR